MKLLCDFSGWFEIGDDVGLQFIGDNDEFEDETKTLKEWKGVLKDKFKLEDFILEDFSLAIIDSTDGEFETLDLEIVEDDNNEELRRDEKRGLYDGLEDISN